MCKPTCCYGRVKLIEKMQKSVATHAVARRYWFKYIFIQDKCINSGNFVPFSAFIFMYISLYCFSVPKKVTKEVERMDSFFATYANTSTGVIEWVYTYSLQPYWNVSSWNRNYDCEVLLYCYAFKIVERFLVSCDFSNVVDNTISNINFVITDSVPLYLIYIKWICLTYIGLFVLSYGGVLIFLVCNSPEGVEKLCSDLNVEHTDVRVLMLAWYVIGCFPLNWIFKAAHIWSVNFIRKMNAKKQGYFTQVCNRRVWSV